MKAGAAPTVHALLSRALKRFAARDAIASGGCSYSYRELDEASSRFANALSDLGIVSGDAVALLLRNCVEFVVADLAILKLGAIKVPLNELIAPPDVAYMVAHSGARGLVVHASLAPLLSEIGAGSLKARVVVEDCESHLAGYTSFATLVSGARSTNPPAPALDPTDSALVIYTGGTTGRSKGVLHVHEALGINLLSHVVNGEIGHDERMLICSPLPHAAQLFVHAALTRGARVTILAKFDPDTVLETIERERITWAFFVPTMIYRLLDRLAERPRDTSSLRTILYGASPITKARLRQALDTFGPVFIQIYGQTEAPNFITTLSKEDHFNDEYLTSCGQPVIFCDVAIRDDTGREVEAGAVGEVTVRSSYTLARYHADPVRTADAFRGEWLRTGDIGYRSRTGHLFLVDRAKDMIISGGMNVYCTEVENVLQEIAGARQVMVVGVPDDDWGEAVVAFLVADPASISIESVLAHCRKRLARYKVPKRVQFVDAIPLTAYGKPDKKVMRAHFWDEHGREIN